VIIDSNQLFAPFYNSNKLPKSFIISDSDYFCPTDLMIKNEIYPKFNWWLKSMKWAQWKHKWDCDNFADAFKLFACGYYERTIESTANGIAIGAIHYMANSRAEDGIQGAHAINIIYAEDEKNDDGTENFKLTFLEPQNGEFYTLTKEEFQSIWMVYI